MTIELVNHCYHYSRLLAYQLSSLIILPPKCDRLKYTIYHTPDDAAVIKVLDFYRDKMPDHVSFNIQEMELPLLRNRAIGRNDAAQRTTADWIWFVDTDYVFADRIWSDLETEIVRSPHSTFFAPLWIRETDWPTGDKLIEDMNTLAVLPTPTIYLPEVKKPIAIGGLQIAAGPVVREIGYAPEIAAKGGSDEWNFRSDISFRHHPVFQPLQEVKLRTLVRIRHTNKGYGQPDRHQVVN